MLLIRHLNRIKDGLISFLVSRLLGRWKDTGSCVDVVEWSTPTEVFS